MNRLKNIGNSRSLVLSALVLLACGYILHNDALACLGLASFLVGIWISAQGRRKAHDKAAGEGASDAVRSLRDAVASLACESTATDKLSRLCEIARSYATADFACYFNLDPQTASLQLKAVDPGPHEGPGGIPLEEVRVPRSNTSALHTCVARARYRSVAASDADPLLRSLAQSHIRRMSLQPIAACGHVLGVMAVGFASDEPAPSHVVAFIKALADIASAALTTQSMKDLLSGGMEGLKELCGITSRIGPQAPLPQVRRAVVETASTALGTDMLALFTIDPCIGGIECECTGIVDENVQSAFLRLYGDFLSDRDRHTALVETGIPQQQVQDEDARAILTDAGIQSVAACPIRSEVGASGALVAFYPVDIAMPNDQAVLEVVGSLVSALLSYAIAVEQSGHLLDDLAGANQELALQATQDGLTGLANHRTLQQALSDMCRSGPSANRRVLSVVMVDVDHFKIYNDSYGHREGDAALRQVAKTISAGLRQGDLAARYGGEEFALVLRGIDKLQAAAVADRIRRAVSEQELRKGSLTISMGIAEFPADGSTSAEVIERADRALYHAKITGRNRVVVWGTAGFASAGSAAPSAPDSTAVGKAVLVVQPPDEADNEIIRRELESSYSVQTCASMEQAGELLRTRSFDVALVSATVLPDEEMKALSTLAAVHSDMPIILIAEGIPVHESREAIRKGAWDILLRPFTPAELPVAIERNVERRRLERQRLTQKSTGIMLQAIDALVAAIDAKDHFTAGHSQRVTAVSLAIVDRMSMSGEDRYALELAARLHDIGKLALPDTALNKQSPLTEEEWQAMRQHPALGSKIVGAIDDLAYVSTIIRHHHERLDGTGYPDGLSGQAIPLLAQVIAVADAYEAMTSDRSYRGRLSPRDAVEELRLHSGTHYIAEVVNHLARHLESTGEMRPQSDASAAA